MKILEDNIYIFLGEVVENGYNYKKCIEEAKKKWNLTFEQAEKIHQIMENHDMVSDNQFEKFTKDLQKIIQKIYK